MPGLLLRAARSALHILGGVCHNIFNVNKCQYASDDERKKLLNDCSTELAEIWRNEPQLKRNAQAVFHGTPHRGILGVGCLNRTCHIGRLTGDTLRRSLGSVNIKSKVVF